MKWRLASAIGLCLSLALLPGACGRSSPSSAAFDPRHLTSLLDLLGEQRSAELQQLVDRIASPGEGSPTWPVYAYLRGEALRKLKHPEAVDAFRQLARWGASQPYGDRWGGSSLAFFGLWRWVQALEDGAPPKADEVEEILRLDQTLRKESRLVRGLFGVSVLDSLPRLEEDTVRRLAALALRAGRKGTAQRIFVEYLTLSQAADLDPGQQQMLDGMVSEGVASREGLLELRAERLESLQNHSAATQLWSKLAATGGPSVRALAGLHLAKIQYQLRGASRSEIAQRLDAVLQEAEDPDVVQEALLTGAMNWSREGSGQDYQRYFDALDQIVRRFPNGSLADDAMYRSALMHWRLFEMTGSEPEFAAAQESFRRVREFQGQNDWLESAHFSPAMALILRGRDDDLRQAIELFETLNRLQPDGQLHRHAAFWRARALEALGSTEDATAAFREVWSEHRYDYYGLRARMHQRLGPAAGSRLWPDAETRKELRNDFGGARADSDFKSGTPYHDRLRTALDAGLYERAAASRLALRRRFPGTRISDASLGLLDETGLLPGLALLLSFRQDAWAAAVSMPGASNHLSILAAVGHRAGDWPLATAFAVGTVHVHDGSELIEANPLFLRSAYAPVFRDVLSKASRDYGVPIELLYAVARRESLFDPDALSPNQALGLFQFLPATFDGLDKRWKLLAESEVSSRDQYLLSPDLSAGLAARWFARELIPRYSKELLPGRDPDVNWFGDALTDDQERAILLSLMEHNAGRPNVRSWLDRWTKQRRQDDLEYMVETAGATETRILVRGVWTDASIASAVELFAPTSR